MMRQGIQGEIKHEALKKAGCYFFSLARWAEARSKQTFTDEHLIYSYDYFVSKGWMEADCFIVNPIAIFNSLVDFPPGFRSISKSLTVPNIDEYIVYLKKPGHVHFVLNYKDRIWDSLDPARPGVNDYKVDSYRVFL